MNKRRDALKAMMAPVTAAALQGDRHARTSVKSGSLKAMGLSLQNLSDEADEAQVLREQLATGSHVIELGPQTIDPSFIRDRLDDAEGADFAALQASIAEHGQQVPILVRPSADQNGRYQIAYGHRRLVALQRLGRPIKAIVRQLTDEELIVAQGKENLERRDLSFIERALFAARLEDHGFGRSALLAALSVHKGNLSTMISVARAVPEELIIAIGSAPKIGRPRWEQLSELLVRSDEAWRKTIATPGFETLDSDVRFTRVLNAMTHRPKKAIARVVKDGEGRALARVEQGKGRVNVMINEKLTGAFGAFLVDQIPEIYLAFLRQSDASTV